ncbi:MAG: acetyl-CoA hydrolase/transferase C-terminal domain-containing protein, partial [Dokdonella sp.]
RNVYDDLALQQALDGDVIGETLRTGDAARLRACGVLSAHLDANEVARLQRFGFLPGEARWMGGRLRVGSDVEITPDLDDPPTLAALDAILTGRRLCGGRYLRGAFYLGSHAFYDWLRGLDGDDYAGLAMTRVSDVNQLYGGRETLDATQRRDARFFNTCMMATLLGAAASDALEDGRVVSGVGGQYNFVAMAHALAGGRSVLLLRATRESGGKRYSNIRWNYGHTTIPRHLRDIYVTEYGVADLRGRSDENCIRAMLSISDAQFVDELAASAIHAQKLPRDFQVPETWRRNTPEHLRKRLAAVERQGLLPAFPFGSDFSAVELRLLPALGWLKRASTSGMSGWLQLAGAFLKAGKSRYPDELARMGLATHDGLKQAITRRLLHGALRRTGD